MNPKLKIETWPIDKVLTYAKNARLHSDSQVAAIAASIKSFGFVNPCLVDASDILIAGHGRILGAKSIGMETVPVIRLGHLTEQQARALRIADNSLPLLATWDRALITAEIGTLKLEGYDLQLLGFPEAQLRGWGVAMGTESEQDPEATPEPPKKPVVRKGDLWILGKHRLFCGDSTKGADVKKLIGDDRPNLLVSDPPYGVDYDPDWRNRADRANGKPYGASAVGRTNNDDRSDWTAAWQLFPGDVAYCWHAGRHASRVQASFEAVGFELRAQIIWAKTRLIISRGHYHMQHEPCWYFVRNGKTGNWCGDRSQTTLWTINHQKSETGHSAQKPIECMKRPIENNSRKNEFIYDPFLGSGTTAIACEMTGRRCLGVEIDPAYCQVVIERWQTFTNRKATLEGKTLEQVAKARRSGLPKGLNAKKAARVAASPEKRASEAP